MWREWFEEGGESASARLGRSLSSHGIGIGMIPFVQYTQFRK